MNTYVLEIRKYIGVNSNTIDEALYKYHEGYNDGETSDEIVSITENNEFFIDDNDNDAA